MNDNITTLIPPFATIPLPKYMRKELDRRISDNYGLNYVDSPSNPHSNKTKGYKGNQSTWIRVVSNGKFKIDGIFKEGFVLRGGAGYKESYGISSARGRNRMILGYDRRGEEHTIDNSFGANRPCPGVESIEVDIRKSIYRLALLKWKCYSREQLEYMTPYFFSPYTTVLVEWGWNTFNESSLCNISDIGLAAKIEENGDIIEEGRGLLGRYTNPQLIEKE